MALLKIKDKSKPRLKKVMIYGLDGSGKSTFAEEYCNRNHLNPIVIDIDDTNCTGLDTVDIEMGNDLKAYKTMLDLISEIKKSEYDTIVIDGVTSLLELLTSNAKGMAAYSDRSKRWNKIISSLLNSGKHLIFIGQADMEVIYTADHQSSKAVIKVNSVVNEKYRTYFEKGEYKYETVKFRTYKGQPLKTGESKKDKISPVYEEPEFTTADDIEPLELDPVHLNYCKTLKQKLINDGKDVTKSNMKRQLLKCIKANEIDEGLKMPLMKFINNKCPEELI